MPVPWSRAYYSKIIGINEEYTIGISRPTSHKQIAGIGNRKNTSALGEASVSAGEPSVATWAPERERVFNTCYLRGTSMRHP